MPAKLGQLSKIWIFTLVFLTAVLVVAFALLPRGFARAAVSDIVCALLMLAVLMVASLNRISSKGRMRSACGERKSVSTDSLTAIDFRIVGNEEVDFWIARYPGASVLVCCGPNELWFSPGPHGQLLAHSHRKHRN